MNWSHELVLMNWASTGPGYRERCAGNVRRHRRPGGSRVPGPGEWIMDTVEAVRTTAPVIAYLPAGFMLDGATYERGGELGFDGIDFYVAGRGGALGEVDGSVVAAAFVFFEPEAIVERWERARKVMGPGESAGAFAGCLASWAHAHLGEGVDYGRLAELEGKVVTSASVAGAPLFAAWA